MSHITIVPARERQGWRDWLAAPFAVLSCWRRAYLVANIVYYGLIVAGMIFTALNRPIQKSLLDALGASMESGGLSTVAGAYSAGDYLGALALTFVINLGVGTVISITLPSLFVPFSGWLVAFYRAFLWGVIFCPTTLDVGAREIAFAAFAAVLLFLEGQGYVLGMLGAYIHGRAWLRPGTVGATTHRVGYWMGLKLTARLYILIALVLLLAAAYEAASVFFS
jgi:hypothetical protein